MALPLTDRRVDVRRHGCIWGVAQATLRPGTPVHVVDLSAAGAQIETERQLRPGSRVHIRIVCDGWSVSVGAQVLRCAVWSIDRDAGVRYRGALRFDGRCGELAESGMQADCVAAMETG